MNHEDTIDRREFMHLASKSALALGILAISQPGASLAQATPTTQPLTSQRFISADVKIVKGPRVKQYLTVGAGRLGEGRYAIWQDQLRLCREELGFDRLRCHGLLQDELGVYREDAKGHPVYNFQHIDMVYDFLLGIGIRPFVEFGFMPDALATIRTEEAGPYGMIVDRDDPARKRRVTVFEWKANVTPPKDPKKWSDLIAALTTHWIDRYGIEEVKQWLFEIWNEPDIEPFFSPNDPKNRRQEYFNLYDVTARAVKSVNGALRVGGPAGASPVYVGPLIAHCAENTIPLDFITYHCYGLGNGAGGLDEFGNQLDYLQHNPDTVANLANAQLPVIKQSAKPELPIYVTEWSASYSSRDPVHDDYFSAPYILQQLKNTPEIATMSYWTFTDIFEENGVAPRAFHGGFGLLNINSIKKPAYFAYRYLHRLGDEELVNSDKQSWVCRDQSGGVQALFWNLTMPSNQSKSNQELFCQVRKPEDAQNVALALSNLAPGRYHLLQYSVGYEKNDAYTAYLKMGSPPSLTPTEVDALKAMASDRADRDEVVTVPANGKWECAFMLRSNDVILVHLKPI